MRAGQKNVTKQHALLRILVSCALVMHFYSASFKGKAGQEETQVDDQARFRCSY